MNDVRTLQWIGDGEGYLRLIDQTRLPGELTYIECRDPEAVWQAIRRLAVRGAPAIGIAAAYGVCLGMQQADRSDPAAFFERLQKVTDYLATSRPTAVNLFWAIKRMIQRALDLQQAGCPLEKIAEELMAEAREIEEEDRQMCREIGRLGAALIESDSGVLTHCNAGGLATADYGTALAVIYAAVESGKSIHVFADETRPLLQGARLTTWELQQRGVPCTLICDSMAAAVMQQGKVAAVVTGADRIAANGDAANKIGTYGVALAAAAHRIPFYVAAPSSTFDLSIASGAEIPIELRDAAEVTNGFGPRIAPEGVDVYNPAFDVTPAPLITAIITERGIIRPVTAENVAAVIGKSEE